MNGVYAYVRPGRSGLGNMLFPWARGVIFSQRHAAPMLSVQWIRPKIGPILRRERDTRFYVGLFSTDGYVTGPRKWAALCLLPRVRENDPAGISSAVERNRGVVVFEGMDGMFAPLLPHRVLVKLKLESMLSRSVRARVAAQIGNSGQTYIALHVRRGDMVTLPYGKAFPSGPGNFALPIEWYVKVVEQLREAMGKRWPVKVFSDGTDAQVAPLMRMDGVSRAPSNPSIVDILLLAKGAILVATSNSTFSGWAAFLGRMPTIYYPGQTYRVNEDPRAIIETDVEGNLPPESAVFLRPRHPESDRH